MVVKVRFDGSVFVPEQPVKLPVGHTLELDISPDSESLGEQFRRLAEEWRNATALHSSSSKRYNHPAYRAIISLGQPVIPLLLRDLSTNRNHWFVALKSITGIDPVAPADAGHIDRMIDAWLKWALEQGWR